MSEDAKGKVIVGLVETETTVLDDLGNVKEIKDEGVLTVKNPSDSHRLWNLKLNIEDTVFTDLEKSNSKDALEPGETWEIPYTINNAKEPILKLTEVINTSKDSSETNHNFYLEVSDDSLLTLTLANTSDKPIQNIKLTKQIPAYLKELKIAQCSGGSPDLDLDSKFLTWEIPSILPAQDAVINIIGRCEIKNSQLKSGEGVEITYESDMNLRSGTVPVLEALTDTSSGVNSDEDDSNPGTWNCTVEFNNDSDIEVTLRTVSVTQKIPTGDESIVDETPDKILGSGEKWEQKFEVQARSVPSFNSKLDFTTNFVVPTKIIGKITQDAQTLFVVQTTITKDIVPPTVKTNANTDIAITNTISNVGTSKIDAIHLTDEIPKDMEPPSMDQIELKLVDSSGEKLAELDKEFASIDIQPDDKESTTPHTITIDFKGLGEKFVPDCKVIMNYPLVARSPQPTSRYDTPVSILSNTAPAGQGFPDKPVEVPNIGIQYGKRNIKSLKSINPAGEGSFKVVVKVTNKGDIEIENITIKEKVPLDFTPHDFTPEDLTASVEDLEDTKVISWVVERLDPDAELVLGYLVDGETEFPRTEPELVVAEADSIKSDRIVEAESGEGVSINDQVFKGKQSGTASNLLDDVIRKLKAGTTFTKAAQMIEDVRDELLSVGKSSPVMQEFKEIARDLRKLGDKNLVAQKLDEVVKKINSWKPRLS